MSAGNLAIHLPTLPEKCQRAIKISFLAPTGYGKTTIVRLMARLFGSVNIRVAAPLYDLQNFFYSFIGKDIDGRQDGEFLQFLGAKIQREQPHFLALRFFENMVYACLDEKVAIITNDDCRPHNYPYLRAWGFKFVAVEGFPRMRPDYTLVDPENTVEWRAGDIPHDLSLCNTGDMDYLKSELLEMMERNFNVNEMLRDPDTNGLQR